MQEPNQLTQHARKKDAPTNVTLFYDRHNGADRYVVQVPYRGTPVKHVFHNHEEAIRFGKHAADFFELSFYDAYQGYLKRNKVVSSWPLINQNQPNKINGNQQQQQPARVFQPVIRRRDKDQAVLPVGEGLEIEDRI